jgi:protein-S-isoprenylcysteine O-methyltransferase Ste14
MTKSIIFIVLSAVIAFLSRNSFRNPQLHGFWRFFGFEFLLLLILLSTEQWFRNPFSVFQILSWFLLISALGLAISGFYLLNRKGRAKLVIEETEVLVQTGPYKLVRHPLYGSLILLSAGCFLKNLQPETLLLFVCACFFFYMTARVEENENMETFGKNYADYMQHTRMFIPFIF